MRFISTNPHLVFLPAILFLSSFGLGLGSLPQFPILLLATLLTYAHATQPRLRKRDPIAAIAAMIPGVAYSFYEVTPEEDIPLNSKPAYFGSLVSIGVTLAVVSVSVIWISVYIQRRNSTIRKNAFIFPLLWSTAFFFMEKNPFGSWGDWGQTVLTGEGFGTWSPILSFGGLIGGNFVIAIISQGLASILQLWLDSFEDEEYDGERTFLINTHISHSKGSNENRNILTAVILAFFLSIWGTITVNFSPDINYSQIRLGCILATPDSTFESLMHDTKVLAAQGAQLLLWSESAIHLDGDKALNEFFNKTLEEAFKQNLYIAVTYSIPVPKTFKRQNLLSLLSPDGTILFNYSKSHPVPFMEYDVLPGPDELVVKEINLPLKEHSKHPRRDGIPLNISAAICHDADFPNTISQAGNADFFLQPAHTWTTASGLSHLAISRARASEQGLSILRCDAGGISAFVDQNAQVRYFKDNKAGTKFIVDVSIKRKYGRTTWYHFLGNGGVFSILIAILGFAGVGELESARRLFAGGEEVVRKLLGPIPGKLMGLLRNRNEGYEQFH